MITGGIAERAGKDLRRSDVPAIRIRTLGRYFGPHVEVDGAERPGEAWRALLIVAGFKVRPVAADDVQRTVTVPGHVLRDISLDIERGSVVCLVGASGTGKSVLLRILAGGIPPTAGSVEMYGTVSSLLAVGDNLDNRLTAVENIQKSKIALGVPPATVASYEADVIRFAGLEGFEHVPIRTFSTGMTLRLSIALALSGNPSIVLIDDVLGVGDIAFQQRCVDRLHELKENNCTLVLAFSDETLVQQLATRVITLGGGQVVSDVQSQHWMPHRFASTAADVEWRTAQQLPQDEVIALRSIEVDLHKDADQSEVEVHFTLDTKAPQLQCWPTIYVVRDRVVIFRSVFSGFVPIAEPGSLTFGVRVPTHILSDGDYIMTFGVATRQDSTIYSLKAHDAVSLSVRRPEQSAVDAAANPMLIVTMPWEIEPLTQSAE